MAVQTSPLEDGSTAVYDDAGNLLYILGRDGTTTNADTSIASDWLKTASTVLSTAIRRDFGLATSAPAASPAPASAPGAALLTPQVKQLMILLAAALIAYKFFA